MHQVLRANWHAADSHELVEAFAAGTAMLMDVLIFGPFEPHPWQAQPDLPDPPEATR